MLPICCRKASACRQPMSVRWASSFSTPMLWYPSPCRMKKIVCNCKSWLRLSARLTSMTGGFPRLTVEMRVKHDAFKGGTWYGKGWRLKAMLQMIFMLYLGVSERHDSQLSIPALVGASSYTKFILLLLSDVTCRDSLLSAAMSLRILDWGLKHGSLRS